MKTSRHHDKRNWRPGPWINEPDRVEWRHRGLPCLIVRNHTGALCGYVAVPPGHPAHGAGYDSVNVDVHGGLTFANHCDTSERALICHTPEPGEPDDVWWLGFDCAHYGDYFEMAFRRPHTDRPHDGGGWLSNRRSSGSGCADRPSKPAESLVQRRVSGHRVCHCRGRESCRSARSDG